MTSTISGAPVPVEVLASPEEGVDAYARWIRRTGLADLTKAAYEREARAFIRWVATSDMHRSEEILLDPHARDYAVRDYRRWLLTDGGGRPRAPKSVDLALTALSSLYEWIGLGKPAAPKAAGRSRHAPQALTEEQSRAVLRAAERRGTRDLALTGLFLHTGLRISELAALDLDDVWITERKGQVQVRAGKGDRPRTIPLGAQVRGLLQPWLATRNAVRSAERALFTTRTGQRMAVRTVRHTIAEVGDAAQVDLHPHLLRHTFATNLLDGGADIVTVGELLGHASLDTTRIYTMPSAQKLDEAVEFLHVDY